jgi:hypothetical protein
LHVPQVRTAALSSTRPVPLAVLVFAPTHQSLRDASTTASEPSAQPPLVTDSIVKTRAVSAHATSVRTPDEAVYWPCQAPYNVIVSDRQNL